MTRKSNENIDIKQNTKILLSIVIPTYKEAENLQRLIITINEIINDAIIEYEVIIVDDNSNDGTIEKIDFLKKRGYPVKLITRTDQKGLSSAVLKGFSECVGDYFLCMDADLSHPPAAIPIMIEYLSNFKDFDMVIGSRYISGASTDTKWSVFRWLNSKIATIIARPFTSVKDPMSGFFAIKKEVYRKANNLNPIGYKIGLEIIVKSKINKIKEIPIHFSDRKYGKSKLNIKEQLNYLKHIKRLADFKFGDISRFLQFSFVGATGLFVDISFFWCLLNIFTLEAARASAICIAMIWNFSINRIITFSYKKRGRIFYQFWKFILSSSVGASLSWSISVTLTKKITLFAGHPVYAAIIGVITGTMSNFLLSRFWVFKQYQ